MSLQLSDNDSTGGSITAQCLPTTDLFVSCNPFQLTGFVSEGVPETPMSVLGSECTFRYICCHEDATVEDIATYLADATSELVAPGE